MSREESQSQPTVVIEIQSCTFFFQALKVSQLFRNGLGFKKLFLADFSCGNVPKEIFPDWQDELGYLECWRDSLLHQSLNFDVGAPLSPRQDGWRPVTVPSLPMSGVLCWRHDAKHNV